jgi:hypothetical protein
MDKLFGRVIIVDCFLSSLKLGQIIMMQGVTFHHKRMKN